MWFYLTSRFIVPFVVVLYCAPIGLSSKKAEEDSCFCLLKGIINDCPCEVETVDAHNNEVIHQLLTSLVRNDYFRYFRVNLQRQCPFWPDDSKCSLKDCHVNVCSEDEIPTELKQAHEKYTKPHSADASPDGCLDETLGDLDKTISAEKSKAFANWTKYDDAQNNFCEMDDDSSSELEYVDLLLNPERYTGYKGTSAHRIWSSIYDENCFKPQPSQTPYGPPRTQDGNLHSLCLEKRVFYRLISGLHTSINVHLVHQYLLRPDSPFGQNEWGPNVKIFQQRFSAETTKGEGPQRLKNLYFIYMVMMRAVVKAAPYLEEEVFFTGNVRKDAEVRKGVSEVIKKLKSFPHHFDESRLFRGIPYEALKLKEEFRSHFRNISRIMDCVGCDKCKLWGKVQTQGIGTALKILFSGHSVGPESTVNPYHKSHFQLRRTEISALFNAFARFSSSIKALEEFRRMLN